MKDDTDQFRILYDANHQRVVGLLARIAGPQEAEDLTQAVFEKAAKALPGFRGGAHASTWLYRIAVNVASDWLRSPSARKAKVTVHLPHAPDEEANASIASRAFGDDQTSPEQELIRKEMNDCIRDVIGQLPEHQRTVLVLGELGGLTDDEVAETLGISRGNAKVRLYRARLRLKQALEGRCDFYRTTDNELACEPKPAAGCASSQQPGCSSARR